MCPAENEFEAVKSFAWVSTKTDRQAKHKFRFVFRQTKENNGNNEEAGERFRARARPNVTGVFVVLYLVYVIRVKK